jgi:hypothetical protein
MEGDVPNGFDQKILVWSAADEDGIGRIAAAWRPYFSSMSIPDSEKTQYLRDLAYTLAMRRSNLPWKTFAIAHLVQDLQNIVDKFATPIRSVSSPGLAFVFTGVWKPPAINHPCIGKMTTRRQAHLGRHGHWMAPSGSKNICSAISGP